MVNVAVFILQQVIPHLSGFPTNAYFALSVEGLRHGFIWQLLTFQFMHGGVIHLALNCWAIFVFGREVEETLGRNSFLTLYLTSGVIGGLFQGLAEVLLPGMFGGQVVGASAGVFGLVAAFATLYPERPLMLLLFFVIPVNMRAKFLLLFSAVLALAGMGLRMGHIAHAAHLGGMITGIVLVRYAIHWHWQWPRLGRSRPQPLRPLVNAPQRKGFLWGQAKLRVEDDLPPDEFLSKTVDPILEKISAQGIQSLTERERRILETARDKMAGR